MDIYTKTVLILLLFAFTRLAAQDVHYSQPQFSPLTLNPANTGDIEDKARFLINYRNQWANILSNDNHKIYAVSVDKKKEFREAYYLGLGFSTQRDVAGEVSFAKTQGNISLSLGRTFKKDSVVRHSLVAGGQIGIAKRSVDPTNARWGTQDINEPPVVLSGFRPSFHNIDYSLGLLWTSRVGSNSSVRIGGAIHHINQPNISFFQGRLARLNARVVLHAAAQLSMKGSLALVPSILYQEQGVHREVLMGSDLKYSADKAQSSYSLGLYYRMGGTSAGSLSGNTLVFASSLRFSRWTIGLAYDYSVAELKTVIGPSNAVEINLAYYLKN